MAQSLIIADDLTGANATGVLLRKVNYNSYTVIDIEGFENIITQNCDCIICPTDSRSIDPEVAYERVFISTKMLKSTDTKFFGKRIDSTLRGNLGTETDAMLDALDDNYIAFVVPCFPQSGRIVCGGYMLVNTIPLHKTEAAIDPKTPVHTSSVKELFSLQSKYKIATLDISDIQKGQAYLIEEIKKFKNQNVKIILFDCIAAEDLEIIADAGINAHIPFICVDPGPFTATVMRKQIVPKKQKINGKFLAVVGSVNPVTKIQLEELFLSQEILNVEIKTEQLIINEKSKQHEIERVVEKLLTQYKNYQVSCLYGDGIFPENRINFNTYMSKFKCSSDEISNLINTAFAEITYSILKKTNNFTGIYTSGGDITVAVSKKFKASGIQLLGEVLPLAAYGELIGGEYDRLRIITKGGMAGDRNAIKDCVQYMKEQENR